jgi:hypothetical protein
VSLRDGQCPQFCLVRQPSSIAKSEFWQTFGVVSLLGTLRLVTLNSDRGSTFFYALLRGNSPEVLQGGFQQNGPARKEQKWSWAPGNRRRHLK